MKYESRKRRRKSLLLAVVMLLQIVMGIAAKPVSVYAKKDIDPFQIFLIEAMSLDFDDRADLTEYLSLNIETVEDINAETIGGVKQWVSALSDAVVENALKIYANRSLDAKFALNALIIKGLEDIEEDLSGFKSIYSIFNETIAGDSSDMRGFRFFISVMLEAKYYTGQSVATDGAPANKIKFQLDGYESEKSRISGFLGLLASLKDTISSYPGSNNFEKLLSFSEQTINSRSDEEIRALKIFLGGDNYKIYSGDPFKEPTPDPQPGGTGGTGGVVNPPVESDKVKEHMEKLQKMTEELEKASDLQKVDLVAELAKELGNGFGVLTDAVESKQKMLELIARALKSINAVVEGTGDENNLSKINGAVVSIVNSASPINNEDRQKIVVSELEKLMNSIIKKIGSVDASIITDESKQQQIYTKMDQVLGLINRLQQTVSKSGLDISLESKIYINLSDAQAEGKYSIELNKDIVTKALEKGIKKVEFVSEIGRAVVTLDSMMNMQELKTIKLNAAEVLLTQQEFDSLTPAQKEIVKPNSKVFTFKANVAIAGGLTFEVSEFIKPIVIHMPYKLKAGETPDTITVFCLDEKGLVSNMSARYDEEEEELIFNTTRLGKFAVKNNVVTFKDVKEGHWGKKWIEAMASKGIVNGKSKDIFDPEGKVTRAEFAKLITITLGLVDSSARSSFKDVKSGDWYEVYVASAYNAGIITGRPDGTFAPNENISRQDMAVMLARALRQQAPADMDKYIDFADKGKIAGYAKQSLAITVKNGLITGKPGNIADPEGNATRAEAATIIYRLFN